MGGDLMTRLAGFVLAVLLAAVFWAWVGAATVLGLLRKAWRR